MVSPESSSSNLDPDLSPLMGSPSRLHRCNYTTRSPSRKIDCSTPYLNFFDTCFMSASATGDVETTQHGPTCDAATSQPTYGTSHESSISIHTVSFHFHFARYMN
ncbi:hypothetical protein L6452_05540 [Arctium lappa]|uniref:Uncharacterized protein n=1 Tax=Arctium lappa TaxID=4217 RepID=A0ACB9EGE6_ARCLA|nr:hypothetical protein L6452_05540 [Arctium lappa]